MRRNAASGRSETPAELIARLTAERASSSAPPSAPGPDAAAGPGRRHRRADGPRATAVATAERPAEQDERPREHDDRPTEQTVAVDAGAVTPLHGSELVSGRDAGTAGDVDDSDDADDTDTPTVGVPVVHAGGGPARSRRFVSRKLAPVAVGAAVMLVATTVATVVATQDRSVAAPELSTAIQQKPTTTVPRPAATSAPPTTTLAPPPVVAPVAAPPKTEEKPSPPPPPKPASSGDGTQAATRYGWKQVGGDEFNGSRYSDAWDAYEGPGHGGNGRRTRDAISVGDGMMTITGDSDGNTGGLAWKDSQRYGKWEMRAKFPAGDEQYHPVLLLWPNGEWPEGGEVDFAETTSASDQVSFFLHYSSENKQKYAHKKLDITQWHNYAVEWVDGRITGYIDGEKWFESTDRSTLPPDKMFAVIQLDWFPEGDAPRETKLHVDYVRIYA